MADASQDLVRLWKWLVWHSLRAHAVAPIWVRIPEKWRWRIVHRLDRSRRRCWSSLVVRHDHEGRHACNCYCGKFEFSAAEGYDDRRARQEADRG